jgi:FAD/FMN-containing dehydrogenase
MLLLARGLDRLLAFDPRTGILCCEAGVTLAEILGFAVPLGWFLPVTPGTKFVTIGGAIAPTMCTERIITWQAHRSPDT